MENLKLTIENYKKIVGQSIYSKWVPQSKGWEVKDMRETDHLYEIILQKDEPHLGMKFIIPIELARQPHYCPYTFMIKYWMKAEKLNNQSASRGYTKEAYQTMDQMLENLAVVFYDVMQK